MALAKQGTDEGTPVIGPCRVLSRLFRFPAGREGSAGFPREIRPHFLLS